LERDIEKVREDVIDDYVSIERAARDYGVVIKEVDADLCEYEIDVKATEKLRAEIRAERVNWARMDPQKVAELYKSGDIDSLDAVRRYGVILEWETGELLPKTTAQFRETFERRSISHWA